MGVGAHSFQDRGLPPCSHGPVSSIYETQNCSGSLPTLAKRRPHQTRGTRVRLEHVRVSGELCAALSAPACIFWRAVPGSGSRLLLPQIR